MLRFVRDLQNCPLISSDGIRSALVKDVYFDDQSWSIRFVVSALTARGSARSLIITEPTQLAFEDDRLRITVPAAELSAQPSVHGALPVCQQYASLSLGSPSSKTFSRVVGGMDPCLRSAKAIANYRTFAGKECTGRFLDFTFDDESWKIRGLIIEQVIDRRRVEFHVPPHAVERFTWATERIILRELRPVELQNDSGVVLPARAA